jgi:hypothetical protein
LPKQQMVALHLAEVFSDSRPRSTDDAGDVLVAERNGQQRAAGIFDAEVVTQVEHRERDAFVEVEVEQAGGAPK